MSDYNYKEQQFIDRINSSLQYISYKILDIEEYFNVRELERVSEIDVESNEMIEIKDAETNSLFEHLIEIKEYSGKSFFYNSIFVNIYSLFEYTLIHYCLYLNQRDNKHNETITEKVVYFEDCKKFLIKEYSMNFGSNKEYNTICLYKDIRDLIVHNQSVIPDKKEYDIHKTIKGIKISTNRIVFINDTKVLSEFLKIVSKFITTIIDDTKKHVC